MSEMPQGDLSEYVRREDGLFVHAGLAGDLTKFSDDSVPGRVAFGTALHALHVDPIGTKIILEGEARGLHPHAAAALVPEHHILGRHHLGPGLVTNVGVMALCNDTQSAAGFSAFQSLSYHMSGTGATAAAATDIALQTILTPPVAVADANALVSAANLQKTSSVATLVYSSTSTVTEWGLFSSPTMSATTGTPFTATSATGGTVTGTPYTASSGTVRGQTQMIVVSGTVYGLITANTAGGLVIPAWYSTTAGTAGSTPGGTAAFTIQPVMWDHKIFSIPVTSGSSIQYSYVLTIASGG